MPEQNQKQEAQSHIEGTVMALAVSPAVAQDGMLFGVTEDGVLFVSSDRAATWSRAKLPSSGMAMSVAVSPTFATDNYLWVSLPEGAIYWSSDRGKIWRDSMATRVMSQTVGIAASPNLAADGIVLAATLDDGIFRSVDRGRTWSPANFGLLDLKTMGVVLAPDFATEQVALAATESSLYRSRNGGLSWKEVGFWEDAVQCAAFSPTFATDRSAWAGCEQSGLRASTDGGVTWQTVESFPAESVNSLAVVLAPEAWLVAGTGQGIYASKDSGKRWKLTVPDVNVMALATGGTGADAWTVAATEDGELLACNGQPVRWQKLP
jgi:photosystem II stability/assembly factor-like uncharacterized protein